MQSTTDAEKQKAEDARVLAYNEIVANTAVLLGKAEARFVFEMRVHVPTSILIDGKPITDEQAQEVAFGVAEVEARKVKGPDGKSLFWYGSRSRFARKERYQSSPAAYLDFEVELTY